MNSRLRSKAFSSGFMAGFTAPYTFFTLRRMRFSHPTGGDLRVAWSDVGRDLDAAIEIEAKNIVKEKRDSTQRNGCEQRDKLSA